MNRRFYKGKENIYMLEEVIQLCSILDDLIDVTHSAYMTTSEADIENRARLDGQIKAYWQVKSIVEDILKVD